MNKEKIYLNRRYVNQRTNNCEKVYLYDKNPEQNKPKFPTFSKRSYKKGDRVVIIGSKQHYKGYHASVKYNRDELLRLTLETNGMEARVPYTNLIPETVYFEITNQSKYIVKEDRHLLSYRRRMGLISAQAIRPV